MYAVVIVFMTSNPTYFLFISDGFFILTINFHFQQLSLSLFLLYRDPRRHRELRQRLKLSCEGLRVHERIDSCCHVLNVFLTKEFDKQLACKIEDIVKKIRESEAYPIPMQVNRLCDLAEEVSTRMKILFLRNKESPEKSWIVLDIDTLLSKINGFIFASEKLPEHCLTPTHTGVLPLSQIQRHLPRELDPSLVVSFLGRLEFCQVVQDPEILSLIRNGKSDMLGMADSDDEVGSLAHHRQSFCSQMSSSSCQTCSSGVSSHTTGSGVSAEHDGYPPILNRADSRDGVLESNWTANLYAVKTSPQRHTQVTNPQTHAPPTSSSPGTELSPSQVTLPTHQFTHPSSTAPLQQQPGNPPSSSSAQQHPLASQQHQTQNEATHFAVQNAQPNHIQQHTSQQQFASSPTIVTPPSLHTPTDPQQIFSPTAPGSSAGELLSPVSATTSVSHSLPHHSPLIDHHERRRQISSPPFSQVSKLHEQFHNLHLTRGIGGGSQPSLPEEQSQMAAGSPPYGAMHRSPSDSCTLSSGQSQHQCNSTRARSQGGSPRVSRHIGCAQSPVFNHDQFLFFPGLVNSGQPSGGMWLRDESFVFYSGWCLESAQPHKFFTPRFLQTLILRLAFGFAVSRRRSNGTLTNTLALFSRECTIWKNGLRWLNLDGVETFVELVEDGRALLLLMRAKMGSELRGVNLRSALIRKILDTKEECCPGVPTEEYLIHPKHLKERESYPVITSRLCHLTRYHVTIVAQAIVAENRRRPCELMYISVMSD